MGSKVRSDSTSSPASSTRTGQRSRRGEDVDDPAPERPLPDPRHGLHPLVAGRLEVLDQRLPIDAVAGPERQDLAPEVGRGRERRLETAGGHDHPQGLARAEAGPGSPRGPRPPRVPRHRARGRRGGTGIRTTSPGRLPAERSREGPEVVEGAERRRLIGHDDDRRAARGEERGQGEGRRGAPQAFERDPLRPRPPGPSAPGRGRPRRPRLGGLAVASAAAALPLTAAPVPGGRTGSPARSTGPRSGGGRPSAP